MKCDSCDHELEIGDWPYCPHGKPHWVVDNFMPYFDEHISTEGEWITSARQRRKIMDANGMEYHEHKRHRKGSAPLFFDMKSQ